MSTDDERLKNRFARANDGFTVRPGDGLSEPYRSLSRVSFVLITCATVIVWGLGWIVIRSPHTREAFSWALGMTFAMVVFAKLVAFVQSAARPPDDSRDR